MKNLTFVLSLLLISTSAFAEAWHSASDIAKRNAGQGGATSYSSRNLCEYKENQTCYVLEGKNLAYDTLQDVSVDDLERPLYGVKMKVEQKSNLAECFSAKDRYCDDQDPGYAVRAVCSPSSELYCIASSPRSYEQKLVKRLIEDASKKTAYDSAQTAAVAEKANRGAKRETRLVSLEDCAKNASPSTVEVNACMRVVAKELVRDRLLEADL